jgi:membrane-bound metal-dependent hydrolase YbcI (DUF457 family)
VARGTALPVVGHAFVGAATGLATSRSCSGATPRVRSFWLPALVVLAYLPDLPGAIAPAAWFGEARALGHSLLFAALLGPLLGVALARWARLRAAPGIAIVVFSVLFHDVLDVLQATDRVPFWPFSRRPWGLGLDVIPRGTVGEALVFAAAFAVFTLGYVWANGTSVLALWPSDGRSRLTSLVATAVVIAAAAVTHLARGSREGDYRAAEAALRDHRYPVALELLDRAAVWPSMAAAGRIDYLRGEAYNGMGDPGRAEQHYLRSYEANPRYYWLLADLALFYAGSDRPGAERRRLVDPLLVRLRENFGGEEELPLLLTRIERRLSGPRSGDGTTVTPP